MKFLLMRDFEKTIQDKKQRDTDMAFRQRHATIIKCKLLSVQQSFVKKGKCEYMRMKCDRKQNKRMDKIDKKSRKMCYIIKRRVLLEWSL